MMVKAKLVQVFLAHDGGVNDIVNGGVHGNVEADLIFVIFLHKCTLGCQFFSTRKLWQKLHKFCIYGDVFYITHIPYVENFRLLHICHVDTSENKTK